MTVLPGLYYIFKVMKSSGRSHIEDNGLNGSNLHELIKGIYIENCDADNNPDESIDVDDNEDECIIINKKPKLSTAKKH